MIISKKIGVKQLSKLNVQKQILFASKPPKIENLTSKIRVPKLSKYF